MGPLRKKADPKVDPRPVSMLLPSGRRYWSQTPKGYRRTRSSSRNIEPKPEGGKIPLWEVREPIGPCHWGIGSQFMRVEFPFLRYNLFFWVYVLSFYPRARTDERFLDAYRLLRGRLDEEGRVVVEHRHRGLKGLDFCAPGEPSSVASRRMKEIEANFDRG